MDIYFCEYFVDIENPRYCINNDECWSLAQCAAKYPDDFQQDDRRSLRHLKHDCPNWPHVMIWSKRMKRQESQYLGNGTSNHQTEPLLGKPHSSCDSFYLGIAVSESQSWPGWLWATSWEEFAWFWGDPCPDCLWHFFSCPSSCIPTSLFD